jgi:hypothetical protein
MHLINLNIHIPLLTFSKSFAEVFDVELVVRGFSLISLLGVTNEIEQMALHRMSMIKNILITSDGDKWSMGCYDDAIGHELDLLDAENS